MSELQKAKEIYYDNGDKCGVGHHESEYIAESIKSYNYIKELEKANSEMLDILIYIYRNGSWYEKSNGDLKSIIEKATGQKIEEVLK
jgi:hypothetical protein